MGRILRFLGAVPLAPAHSGTGRFARNPLSLAPILAGRTAIRPQVRPYALALSFLSKKTSRRCSLRDCDERCPAQSSSAQSSDAEALSRNFFRPTRRRTDWRALRRTYKRIRTRERYAHAG